MSTEYDDLDDLLDDTELNESILSKPPGAAAQQAGTREPDIGRLNLGEPKDEISPGDASGLEALLNSLENGNDPDKALRSLLEQLNQTSDSDPVSTSDSQQQSDPQNFEDTISATMDRLKKSQKSGTTDENDTDMLAQLLKDLQGGTASGEGVPASGLDGILGNLLSELATKEVLYEPLKELDTNYPDWMAKNSADLEPKERERLEKQQQIVSVVVSHFEAPGYSDKKPQCREFITEKMAEMQETGAPPSDLVGDVAGGGIPGMDSSDAPDLPSDCATQ